LIERFGKKLTLEDYVFLADKNSKPLNLEDYVELESDDIKNTSTEEVEESDINDGVIKTIKIELWLKIKINVDCLLFPFQSQPLWLMHLSQ